MVPDDRLRSGGRDPGGHRQLLPSAPIIYRGIACRRVCAGCAISALCGMAVKRASIAAAIYLVIQGGIEFTLFAMMSST